MRLVAATNRDLEAQVKSGEFREDLFYRSKVVELKLPPLKDRKEDVPLLIRRFITDIAAEARRQRRDIETAALEVLKIYSWPGNVRELRITLEGMIVLSMKSAISRRTSPTAPNRKPSLNRG